MPTFYLIQPGNKVVESLDRLVVTEATTIKPFEAINRTHANVISRPQVIAGGRGYGTLQVNAAAFGVVIGGVTVAHPQIRPLIDVLKAMLGDEE